MKTALGHETTTTHNLDLKGRIANAVVRGRLSNDGLVLRAHAEEQRQLKDQKGPLKSSHIYERNSRYNFGLTTLYKEGVGILQQHIVSITKNGDIVVYHISRGENVSNRLFKYYGVLTREGVPYSGVSQDEGVAEVLLGERRVSQHQH